MQAIILNPEWLNQQLIHCGHVIIRNTHISTPKQLEEFGQQLVDITDYSGGIAVRDRYANSVYSLNAYVPSYENFLHQDLSYVQQVQIGRASCRERV